MPYRRVPRFGKVHSSTPAAASPHPSAHGHLASYRFDDTGHFGYHTKASRPANIHINDLDGNPVNIKRLDPSEALKVLGFLQALDGNMVAQVQDLKGRADSWGLSIRHKKLPRKLAWMALPHHIWSSIRYPLVATTMTPEQGESVLKKFYRSMLPVLGVCRSIPKEVRHAPMGMLGLGAPQIYPEQGIRSLKQFLLHVYLPKERSSLGWMYRATVQQTQLAVGSATPFFSLSYRRYGNLATDCLIKSIWRFCSETGLLIQGNQVHLPLQRANDCCLMDEVRQWEVLTDLEEEGFNRVRQRLKVSCLSDITTGDGKHLDQENFFRPPAAITSSYEFPKEVPCVTDWRAWRKGLRLLTQDSDTLLRTDLHLGAWTQPPHRRTTEWWYDPPTQQLYQRIGQSQTGYLVYRYAGTTSVRHGSPFHRHGLSTTLPETATRATAYSSAGITRFSGTALTVPTPPPLHTSLRSVILSLDASWPLEYSHFPDDGAIFAQAIRDGTAQGVCDGSYYGELAPHLAAAAWIAEDSRCVVSTQPSPGSCSGLVRCSGTPEETNPHRAEYQGFHAFLLFLKAVCIYHNITVGSIRLACDNNNCIKDASDRRLKVPATRRHVDLVRAIRHLIYHLPISVQAEQIKGHQDDHIPIHCLPRMAQLNVIVDDRAKTFLKGLIHHDSLLPNGLPPCPSDIHGEGWTVTVSGVKMTGDPSQAILFDFAAPAMRDYLHRRNFLPRHLFSHIDWPGIQLAADSLPRLFNMWAAKNACNWCGVGKMMYLWKEWTTHNCPCCGEPQETARHVPTCPDERMRRSWMANIPGFELWLADTDTHPDIITCIINTIEDGDPTTRFTDWAEPTVLEAAIDQDEIGWSNFLEGRLSNQWRVIQQQYFISIRSRRTVQRWMADLITNILQLTHKAWTTRNDIVHEKTKGISAAQAEANAAQIELEFSIGSEQILAKDKHLFTDRTQDHLLCLNSNAHQNWIDEVAEARKQYHEHQTATVAQMRTRMHNYLSLP